MARHSTLGPAIELEGVRIPPDLDLIEMQVIPAEELDANEKGQNRRRGNPAEGIQMRGDPSTPPKGASSLRV